MQIQFACPRCERSVRQPVGTAEGLKCRQCDWERPIDAANISPEGPAQCLLCGCPDLWRQKDFPQRLGVAMVAAGAISFAIAMAFYLPVLGIGILLAFAAVDLLLFVYMPDVLVCYRCQAKYGQVPSLADTAYFHLETFERYRQEAARLEQANSKSGA